ncbi:MAG: RNA polymerase sigma-70 factor (ECF subfamily) [Flavobacterium sp.]
MDQEQELDLVVRVGEGNTEAYQSLLRHHLPSLNRYVTRMIGNAQDTEEILQDVFLRLWQKSNQFNSRQSKLTTWLHQIAHNRCIDEFRKKKPQIVDLNEIEDFELVGQDNPQEEFINGQKNQQLAAAIQQLPENQKSALLLSYYQGLSNKQTAQILSISVEALESLLVRSRKKLQQSLDGVRL